MSRFRFELATEQDDADLRAVLANTPMDGAVAVTFRREPSFFRAAAVEGAFCQVVACRDTDTGRIVGFGSRSIRQRYVNGLLQPIGYLSSLRLLTEWRKRGLVARGYAFFRRLHADGRTPLYFTTIAEGNAVALKNLTSPRAGLPRYHFAGKYHTAALPLGVRRPKGGAEVEVQPAAAGDLAEILEFLQREGPKRQLFPCYRAEDFFAAGTGLVDLRPEQMLLARRGGRIMGVLAGWEQQAFKQTVINGYSSLLRWLRPLVNCAARLHGAPRLPPPGQALHYLTAALPVVADDDRVVFNSLLERLLEQSAGQSCSHLLLGLHESDPLLSVVRQYRPHWYTTRLYLVCWDDGDILRQSLDGRPLYLELGCL